MKRLLGLLILCLYMTALLCGCGSAQEPEQTADAPQLQETEAVTEEPTEAEPVYEMQTVYLCVLKTQTNYEDNSEFKTQMAYNEYGQLVEKWRPEADGSKSSVTTYVYDELGNCTEENTEYGRYERTYDEQGRMLSELYYSSDVCKSEYRYTYDEAGFVVEEVRISRYSDERNETYQITYNADHTESLIHYFRNGEANGYTKETYDGNGNVLTTNSYDQNDAWTGGITYEYDAQGRIAVEQHSSSRETQPDYDVIYTYDENGLLLSKNVDYYYGYLTEYTYEPFEILVRVN